MSAHSLSNSTRPRVRKSGRPDATRSAEPALEALKTLIFTATALEPTKAIFFHGTRQRECCAENHDLGYELMKRMAEVMLHRIEAASRLLLECPAKSP